MAGTSGFHDHFSGHAADCRRFRPDYPPELFEYLASLAPHTELAWDCGTGNGQAAVALAYHFRKVIASDASVKQVEEAEPRANIEYLFAPAEHAPLRDTSVDLVNVSQALHWFEHPRFFAEVRRVAKPGGIFSATAYDVHAVNPAVDPILERLENEFVGPYWPAERELLKSG